MNETLYRIENYRVVPASHYGAQTLRQARSEFTHMLDPQQVILKELLSSSDSKEVTMHFRRVSHEIMLADHLTINFSGGKALQRLDQKMCGDILPVLSHKGSRGEEPVETFPSSGTIAELLLRQGMETQRHDFDNALMVIYDGQYMIDLGTSSYVAHIEMRNLEAQSIWNDEKMSTWLIDFMDADEQKVSADDFD